MPFRPAIAGQNTVKDVLAIAVPIVQARNGLAASGHQLPELTQSGLSLICAQPGAARSTSFVQIVDPANEFRNFDRSYVEVDNQSLLPTPRYHAMKLNVVARIDLLMRNVGRDVNEIAGLRLCDKLQMISPTHAGEPIDDVDHALEIAVVVRPRLCLGIDGHRAGP